MTLLLIARLLLLLFGGASVVSLFAAPLPVFLALAVALVATTFLPKFVR